MDYQLGPGPLQVDQNTIDEKIKGDIGIVENGDVATHAIPSGYYVIWKGDLYVAKTDISSGTTLSASNLTAKPNGLGADVATLKTAIMPGNNRNDFSEYDTIHKIFGGIRAVTDGSAFGNVGAMQNTALRTLLGNPGIGNYVRCNMILVNWSSILCIAVSEASFTEPKIKWLYHADYSDAENYYNQTEWSKVNLNSDIASLNSKTTFSLTVPSGITVLNSNCYILGRTVYISGRIKVEGGTTAKTIGLGDAIPTSYMYNDRLGFAAFNNATDESLHGIISARSITFYRPEETTLSEIEFSVSYAI